MSSEHHQTGVETIRLGDGDFISVRPLTDAELFQILEPVARRSGELLNGIPLADFVRMGNDPDLIKGIATALAIEAPDIIVRAVAIAADAEDQIEVVSRLPLAAMLLAIEKVATLTFADPGRFRAVINRLSGHVLFATSLWSAP